jgi:hypothetical protein
MLIATEQSKLPRLNGNRTLTAVRQLSLSSAKYKQSLSSNPILSPSISELFSDKCLDLLSDFLPFNISDNNFVLITTGFLDFAHRPEFYKQENTTFRKLDLFPSSGEGGGGTYSIRNLRKGLP